MSPTDRETSVQPNRRYEFKNTLFLNRIHPLKLPNAKLEYPEASFAATSRASASRFDRTSRVSALRFPATSSASSLKFVRATVQFAADLGAPASRRLISAAFRFRPNFTNRLLFISFLALSASLTPSANAEELRYEYTMGGKAVTQEAYDAFNQGRQLLRVNNNSDATMLLKKATELMPDNADAHHTYAIALAKTGQSSTAIQELQTAISLNSNLAPSWETLGGLYQTTGQLDKAIETYKGFLSRFPTDRDAKKIAGLVSGLETERLKQQAAYGIAGIPPSDHDYYVEVTRDGVFRWSPQQMPLKVYITSGDGIGGYRPQFGDILKQAFASWSQASGGLITFSLVDSPDQAQIVCLWTNDPTKFKNIAESGHAVLDTTRNGLVKGTITILTVPLVEQLPLTDNRMRRGCLHEIGHALGLGGHSSNPDDAMFYSMDMDDKWKDLSPRDANTIVRLYSKTPATSSLR